MTDDDYGLPDESGDGYAYTGEPWDPDPLAGIYDTWDPHAEPPEGGQEPVEPELPDGAWERMTPDEREQWILGE